jgi:enterochelin esterase-like enzyme
VKRWNVLLAGLLLCPLIVCPLNAVDQPAIPTLQSLQAGLAANLQGSDAEQLAERIRRAFGGRENLLKGPRPLIDELTVAWALEAPGAAASLPRVLSEDGRFTLQLTRVGGTSLYAAVTTLPSGTAMLWHYQIGDKTIAGGPLEAYAVPPESLDQRNPKGTLKQMPNWLSTIFDGTTRDWWVYVPAQYKAEHPACVMVFQDGALYKEFVPTVFDNLIAKGEMPVTVGIFINPGRFKEGEEFLRFKNDHFAQLNAVGGSNRSFEYDTLSDRYARFLLEEILPEVEKNMNLRHDASSRAIAGISSGAICAFTVAWERPLEFSKVLSWVGSFTNIACGRTLREGGHNYQAMIRKKPKKPIRIFLQDGENDVDDINGNWPLANQEMAKALSYVGYDFRFEYGQGFHSEKHGRAILPEALRWLWRDPKP